MNNPIDGLEELFQAKEKGICPFCTREVKEEDLKNELSKKEYNISGLCQRCQDDFFISAFYE